MSYKLPLCDCLLISAAKRLFLLIKINKQGYNKFVNF